MRREHAHVVRALKQDVACANLRTLEERPNDVVQVERNRRIRYDRVSVILKIRPSHVVLLRETEDVVKSVVLPPLDEPLCERASRTKVVRTLVVLAVGILRPCVISLVGRSSDDTASSIIVVHKQRVPRWFVRVLVATNERGTDFHPLDDVLVVECRILIPKVRLMRIYHCSSRIVVRYVAKQTPRLCCLTKVKHHFSNRNIVRRSVLRCNPHSTDPVQLQVNSVGET